MTWHPGLQPAEKRQQTRQEVINNTAKQCKSADVVDLILRVFTHGPTPHGALNGLPLMAQPHFGSF